MAEALCVAIVGAESTGKTTLTAALAQQLAQTSGLRVAWVPEVLREWCDGMGRTPQAQEQAAILQAQHDRITAAAATHDVVVCDTTPLMTAVYSRLVFGDSSLDERALQLHGKLALTLLMALDLPWVADGHQRDGPHVREPVDTLLRTLMLSRQLPFAVVGGVGQARVAQALAAVTPLLRNSALAHMSSLATVDHAAPRLFTGLVTTPDAGSQRLWACECCVPECERALLRP